MFIWSGCIYLVMAQSSLSRSIPYLTRGVSSFYWEGGGIIGYKEFFFSGVLGNPNETSCFEISLHIVKFRKFYVFLKFFAKKIFCKNLWKCLKNFQILWKWILHYTARTLSSSPCRPAPSWEPQTKHYIRWEQFLVKCRLYIAFVGWCCIFL